MTMNQTIKCCCPICGSSNTKTLSVIYESGTYHYSGRSTGSGVSFGSGSTRFGFWSGTSHGVRQSSLSANAAPKNLFAVPDGFLSIFSHIAYIFSCICIFVMPLRKSLGYMQIIFSVILLFALSYAIFVSFYFIIFILILYFFVILFCNNDAELESWRKTWKCLRCGHHFEI
jgi:hypothetical protein